MQGWRGVLADFDVKIPPTAPPLPGVQSSSLFRLSLAPRAERQHIELRRTDGHKIPLNFDIKILLHPQVIREASNREHKDFDVKITPFFCYWDPD